jgi:hypothetical protein
MPARMLQKTGTRSACVGQIRSVFLRKQSRTQAGSLRLHSTSVVHGERVIAN